MDAKALAKSKRAHSMQHSKKHHPNPSSKAVSVSSVGESGAKKPSLKQVSDKSHHLKGSSALPTNWDRYEEEYSLDSEDPSNSHMSQASDVVCRSKGADYAHLISEAMSQSQTSLEGFPSFDDDLSDFNQEVGSLLSVKGQGILSWAGDDNFVVEDVTTSNPEASFLSINLHLIGEEIVKVDVSERLLIEPLPPDLSLEELDTSFSQESDQVQAAYPNEEMKKNSDHLLVNNDGDIDKMKDQKIVSLPSDSSVIGHSVSATSIQGLKTSNQAKDEPKKKESRLEATDVEAELDTLLDSFNETKFLDSSSVFKKFSARLSTEEEKSSSRSEGTSKLGPAQPLREDSKLSAPASFANSFDDTLDDLLNETSASVPISVQRGETTTLQPLRKGADIPKSAVVIASFHDDLDDLLNETSSNVANYKGTPQSSEVSAQLNTMPSDSTSKSKALDDFDSWFDTLS